MPLLSLSMTCMHYTIITHFHTLIMPRYYNMILTVAPLETNNCTTSELPFLNAIFNGVSPTYNNNILNQYTITTIQNIYTISNKIIGSYTVLVFFYHIYHMNGSYTHDVKLKSGRLLYKKLLP